MLVLALCLLWPALTITEFRPQTLFASDSLRVMGGFLADFVPPALSVEFLGLLVRATLETLAIATAGIALALVLALPLGFAMTRSLSISRIGPGRGHWRGQAVRSAARTALVGLRAIPEVVWALVLVRVLGLGPAAGVLALALTYGGMLGKVYAEILESGTPGLRAHCWKPAAAAWRPCATDSCPALRRNWCLTPSTAGNARCARRW